MVSKIHHVILDAARVKPSISRASRHTGAPLPPETGGSKDSVDFFFFMEVELGLTNKNREL